MKEAKSSAVAILLESEAFTDRDNVVDGFIVVLRWLWKQDPEQFDKSVEDLSGQQFAKSRQALIERSLKCEPRQIRDTGYWVKTNNRTATKQKIIDELMRKCGHTHADIAKVIKELAVRNGNP